MGRTLKSSLSRFAKLKRKKWHIMPHDTCVAFLMWHIYEFWQQKPKLSFFLNFNRSKLNQKRIKDWNIIFVII